MLVKSISKSVFGSAVAGFGFSLGRDIYKTGKGKDDSKPFIIAFIAAILAIYLTFMSGLWFSRNYKSFFVSIIMKLISLTLVTCIGFVWFELFVRPRENPTDPISTTTISVEYLTSNWLYWIPVAIFILGVLFGMTQRKKRKYAWEAETYNSDFLTKNGFSEQDGFIIDKSGQKYRIENTTPNHIELFPIRRRGKRGYLQLDSTGKISSWSGMVKI